MNTNRSTIKILILAIGLMTLHACVSTATRHETPERQLSRNKTSLSDKKVSLRSLIRRYEKQAKTATSPSERQYYLLLAAETLMDHNRPDVAQRFMAAIDASHMDDMQRLRLSILKAEQDTKNGRYPLALQKLPKQILDLPPKVQARVLKIRAEAFNELGYLTKSIETRIQLSSRLNSLKRIEENNAAIWSLLNTLPEPELNQLLDQRGNTGLKAWVQLVLGLQRSQTQQARETFLDKWYSYYPAHPASDSFIEKLREAGSLIPTHPNKIAVLLPLSSKNQTLASVAEAIRDGFLAAHYNHSITSKPDIRIYDVGDEPEKIEEHHQKAQMDGAKLIVGPLNKKAVTQLTKASNHKAPILALNYTLDNAINSNYVFQFGLLPEDEARQVAELAIINKQTRAIVLTPRTSLGKRLYTAFSEHYQQLGGEILTTEFYAPNAKDHSTSIQRSLNLLQSKTRDSLLRSTIKQGIKFNPRRRQDVDAIFIVANPTQARILKPMLAYYNAGDIPAYTTSTAFNGTSNPRQDSDLNGLNIVDQPWILKSSDNEQYKALKTYWPQKIQTNARYYALGIDAYRVIPYLNKLKLNPLERFSGYTGSLSIDHNNRIHRELIWAQFEKGVPQVVELLALEDN